MPHLKPSNNRDAKAILIGGLLILLVGGYFIGRALLVKNDTEESTEVAKIEEEKKNTTFITPEVVRRKLINGEPIKFLDIRPKEAFETEHIPGSLWLSPSALGNFAAEDNDILVIVYSETDLQTFEVAKNILEQKSFTAFFLEGGFEGWKKTSNQTISYGDPNSFVDQSKIVYISATELLKLLSEPETDVFLLDVQSENNFHKVHLKGAKNIPLDQLEKRTKELPSGKQIVVYGENELVSFQAGVRLADLNFFTVKTLSGNKNLTAESGLSLEPVPAQ